MGYPAGMFGISPAIPRDVIKCSLVYLLELFYF